MNNYNDKNNRQFRKAAAGVPSSAMRRVTAIVLLVIALIAVGIAFIVVRYPVRHAEIINKYSAQYHLDPVFVYALINAESRFNENAVSGAGASGLMQIMEDTANWIAPKAGLSDFSYSQIFDPDVNIRLGCFYLSMYLERFGDMETALCAYNAGGGTIEGWLSDSQYSSNGITLDYIPYPETRHYVERVMEYTKVYEVILRFAG